MSVSEAPASAGQSVESFRGADGTFLPGNRANPGGRSGAGMLAMTRIMDRVLLDDPEATYQRLVALRDSEQARDRQTFWGLAGKRIATADGERGLPAGGIIIQVITGVPSPLPMVIETTGGTTEAQITEYVPKVLANDPETKLQAH